MMQRLKRIPQNASWVWLLARLAVASVFVYAGAAKLVDPRAFARVIYEYGLVPDVVLVPVAVALPVMELLVGIGLAFNVRGCLEAVMGLLVLFIVVLAYAVYFNLDVDCGCFSTEELQAQQSVKAAFYRDLAMLAVSTCLFLRRRMSLDRPGLKDGALLTS